ncbi:hypothetical protein FHS95_004077 [Sphingomonas naasensis]|uniref:Uncharacterized protein n=1 Tax=Sphingomonas naasensis TaxID=1344951 RepID=A0A4V3QVZ5_9SPHN|nr:hypothetical protein [Sphingomonas naasensis]NIJ22362.1 hypothetical protein [Sphingomonas naasensis]TGX40642.1 hypothetical protein E5A74_14140 [Sphingomonas naasensis]
MPDAAEARDALDRIDASRAQLALAANCPPARHLAFAGVMGALVLSPLAGPYQILTLAPIALAVALIVQWDRRRLGMFINGYRRGKTRLVTAGLLLLILPVYFASFWLAFEAKLVWPSILLAAAATLISYVGSTIWQRVFRREMGLAA